MIPLRTHWRVLVGVPCVAMLLVGIATFAQPRSYEASAVLATVGGGKSLGSLGQLAGAAAALGGGSVSPGDLTPTPDLVTALLTSRRVLGSVGALTDSANKPVVQRLRGKLVGAGDIPRVMSRYIRTDIGTQTGLVTISVRHRDSGLARFVQNAVIEEMTIAYVEVARAQARGLRLAQEARVDSALRQLVRAEESFRGFLQSNRIVAEFSIASIERDRLVRDVAVAQQIFMQASADRESAVAQELQETPAVVVVDPTPAQLPQHPRQLAVKLLLAFVGGLLAAVFWVYLRYPNA